MLSTMVGDFMSTSRRPSNIAPRIGAEELAVPLLMPPFYGSRIAGEGHPATPRGGGRSPGTASSGERPLGGRVAPPEAKEAKALSPYGGEAFQLQAFNRVSLLCAPSLSSDSFGRIQGACHTSPSLTFSGHGREPQLLLSVRLRLTDLRPAELVISALGRFPPFLWTPGSSFSRREPSG
jgi:hypothetical protein